MMTFPLTALASLLVQAAARRDEQAEDARHWARVGPRAGIDPSLQARLPSFMLPTKHGSDAALRSLMMPANPEGGGRVNLRRVHDLADFDVLVGNA